MRRLLYILTAVALIHFSFGQTNRAPSQYAGVYLGKFTFDSTPPASARGYSDFGLYVRSDGTGVFMAGTHVSTNVSTSELPIWQEVFVNDQGHFRLGIQEPSLTGDETVPRPGAAYLIDASISASGTVTGTLAINGSGVGIQVNGQELTLTIQSFSGVRSPASGPALPYVGFYRGPMISFIVGADGNGFDLFGSTASGSVTVDGVGNFSGDASFRFTFAGSINLTAGAAAGGLLDRWFI
jgi:hypothetical protein